MAHAPTAATTRAPAETAFDLDRARLALVARGFQEVITYSFVNPELQELVAPGQPVLTLANPISADLSVMRTSLWPGLLQAARQNLARQQERVRIFESGLRYLPESAPEPAQAEGNAGIPRQDAMIGGLVVGPVLPEQWGQSPRGADFFDLKADVEAILGLTGCPEAYAFVPAEHPALHPGQSARIERDGQEVGRIGMLHPALAARLDIGGRCLSVRTRPRRAGRRAPARLPAPVQIPVHPPRHRHRGGRSGQPGTNRGLYRRRRSRNCCKTVRLVRCLSGRQDRVRAKKSRFGIDFTGIFPDTYRSRG